MNDKLDEQAQKILDGILAKPSVDELTDFERGFLRARWHYVKSKNDRNKFKAVFDDKPQEEVADTSDTEPTNTDPFNPNDDDGEDE